MIKHASWRMRMEEYHHVLHTGLRRFAFLFDHGYNRYHGGFSFHTTFLALRSYQGWMYFAPLEVLGISQKFEEAVEVNCLGSKGDGGEDGYFMVFSMGPPPDFELQKGESLEISEQVMERYLCWVEFYSTHIYSKNPWSNMFINIVDTRGSATSVKRIMLPTPQGFQAES